MSACSALRNPKPRLKPVNRWSSSGTRERVPFRLVVGEGMPFRLVVGEGMPFRLAVGERVAGEMKCEGGRVCGGEVRAVMAGLGSSGSFDCVTHDGTVLHFAQDDADFDMEHLGLKPLDEIDFVVGLKPPPSHR